MTGEERRYDRTLMEMSEIWQIGEVGEEWEIQLINFYPALSVSLEYLYDNLFTYLLMMRVIKH